MTPLEIIIIYFIIGAICAILWHLVDRINVPYNYVHGLFEDFLNMVFWPVMIIMNMIKNKNC